MSVSERIKNGLPATYSATTKVISIGVLVLILMIPASMVSSLLHERESRKNSVVQEISGKWGTAQIITGPYISVPYKSYYADKEGNLTRFTTRYLHILPESLNISSKIEPFIRYRGIYEAVLYETRTSLKGAFRIPDLTAASIEPQNIMWNKASVNLGISDMRGIMNNIKFKIKGTEYKASSGLSTRHLAGSGVHSSIQFNAPDIISGKSLMDYSVDLSLRGSQSIHYIPLGETTTVKTESQWSSPSFIGSVLPAEREVTEKGFTASWKVLHLNRNFPQFWTDKAWSVQESTFGVRLLITADIYQKTTRVAKYAFMFMIFTFAAFFFAEIINKRRVHPIQYLLTGLGVVLFYVLLLSIAEHIGFDLAYIISASSITLLITLYANSVIKSRSFTLTIFGILVILYSYLYMVLQLEDYALLAGSIGLFGILSAVMYITRNIDWYSLNEFE